MSTYAWNPVLPPYMNWDAANRTLGINITPVSALHVYSSINTVVRLDTSQTSCYILFQKNASNKGYIGYQDAAGGIVFVNAAGNQVNFSVSDAGNATINGTVRYNGTNSTGAGSASLSNNCPAVTAAAPYTWIQALSADGSTVYIPCWK